MSSNPGRTGVLGTSVLSRRPYLNQKVNKYLRSTTYEMIVITHCPELIMLVSMIYSRSHIHTAWMYVYCRVWKLVYQSHELTSVSYLYEESLYYVYINQSIKGSMLIMDLGTD